jgi:hypothetical protein
MNLTWTKTKKRAFIRGTFINMESGCSCLFLHLTPKTGIKIYGSKRDRDYAYNMQKKAHDLGIGPAIGDMIQIGSKRNAEFFAIRRYLMLDCPFNWSENVRAPFYGYITEIVHIPNDGICLDKMDILEKLMKESGFATGDVGYCHNVGLINDKAVCYDFDTVSMSIYND